MQHNRLISLIFHLPFERNAQQSLMRQNARFEHYVLYLNNTRPIFHTHHQFYSIKNKDYKFGTSNAMPYERLECVFDVNIYNYIMLYPIAGIGIRSRGTDQTEEGRQSDLQFRQLYVFIHLIGSSDIAD